MKFIILLFLYSLTTFVYAQDVPQVSRGRVLYESKCIRCHGSEGDKGLWGAKNLQRSTLSEADCFALVSNGKGKMPAWKNRLTPTEIKEVIQFIQTLQH